MSRLGAPSKKCFQNQHNPGCGNPARRRRSECDTDKRPQRQAKQQNRRELAGEFGCHQRVSAKKLKNRIVQEWNPDAMEELEILAHMLSRGHPAQWIVYLKGTVVGEPIEPQGGLQRVDERNQHPREQEELRKPYSERFHPTGGGPMAFSVQKTGNLRHKLNVRW